MEKERMRLTAEVKKRSTRNVLLAAWQLQEKADADTQKYISWNKTDYWLLTIGYYLQRIHMECSPCSHYSQFMERKLAGSILSCRLSRFDFIVPAIGYYSNYPIQLEIG